MLIASFLDQMSIIFNIAVQVGRVFKKIQKYIEENRYEANK